MIETALIVGINGMTLAIVGIIFGFVWKMNRELGEHSADIKYIKQQINKNNGICEESEHEL